MFYNCESLSSIDLGNFETVQIKDMSRMFYNCYNLKYLDISGFQIKSDLNVTLFENIPNKGIIKIKQSFLKKINDKDLIEWDKILI